jgi:hypothetical protein
MSVLLFPSEVRVDRTVLQVGAPVSVSKHAISWPETDQAGVFSVQSSLKNPFSPLKMRLLVAPPVFASVTASRLGERTRARIPFLPVFD